MSVLNSEASNRKNGIAAGSKAVVYSGTNTGTGNVVGLSATVGGKIGKYSTQPDGTTTESFGSGGVINGDVIINTVNSGFTAGFTGSVRTIKGNDNMITVNVTLTKDSDISTGGTALYTLPPGYRPNQNIFELCNLLTNSGVSTTALAIISINTSGVITVNPISGAALTNARQIQSKQFTFYAQ